MSWQSHMPFDKPKEKEGDFFEAEFNEGMSESIALQPDYQVPFDQNIIAQDLFSQRPK